MLRKVLLIVSALFYFVIQGFSQGSLRGKLTDEQGEAIVGAIIYLQDKREINTLSDFDGNFSLDIKDTLSHSVVIAYIGYKEIVHKINAMRGKQTQVVNFSMLLNNTLVEVDIVAKQVKANDLYMEKLKKEAAVSIDYISSETMKKTGDATVVNAVARVSGVSSSGGLITVRGIGDRYVKTTLNGLRLPTLDPLTNNIKLDIFPASLIDNVTITKTSSPDLPGDCSGAYISIDTKDYPENLIVNCDMQVGYNQQTSFRTILSTERSKTDWLGFDTGLRDRTHGPVATPIVQPTTYQEMAALGLQNYYAGMGVSGWADGSPEGTDLFKLGLVQLGLLAAADFTNNAAFVEARIKYNENYKPKAFSILNPEGSNYSDGFANNWNPVYRKAPLNFSQSYSVGNQLKLFGKPLGYIVGLRFANSVRFDPNGYSKRLGQEFNGTYPLITEDLALICREVNGWNVLLNLAFKPNSNNSFAYLFMPNISGTNDSQLFTTISDGTNAQESTISNTQFYEERKQFVNQLKTEHYIKQSKTKIESNFAYTIGSSKVPDFKAVDYGFLRNNQTNEISDYLFGPSVGAGVRRFYRYLDENLFDSKISAELPISTSTVGVRKIKFGGAYQFLNREQNLYDYRLAAGNSIEPPTLTSNDINSIMGDEQFTVKNGQVAYFYQDGSAIWNNTFGYSKITSAYVLADYSFNRFLRASGGLRLEQSKIFADVVAYHNLNLPVNDIRRENVGGYPYVNPANIKELNFLPSVNIIIKTKENRKVQWQYRLNYSHTIARPSIRELNDGAIFDQEFRTLIYGNSDLKIAEVDNYDLRTEMFFKNGDNISVSAFAKAFTNHIEASFGSGGISWNNVGASDVRGIEFEGRKLLFKSLEARCNVTFVKSNSQVVRSILDVVEGKKLYTPVDTINRPMYGQAPYIVNTILSYKADSIGMVVTVSYNLQGRRLVIAGILKGDPDVYEMPRHLLDIKVSKKLSKRFTLSITVRDIINSPVRRAYLLPSGYSDFDNFRYGTNYLLSISYKI